MRGALFQAICRVGIFIICARAIVHFRPRETYEKFLKLLVSVMVLIQLFLPIGSFLLGDGMEEAVKRLERLQEELERELELTAGEAEEADRMLESMTLEEIRRRMEEAEDGKEGAEEQKGGEPGTEKQEDGNEGAEEQKSGEPGTEKQENGNERAEKQETGGGKNSVEEISVTVDPIVRGSGD
ncbi:MAG: hypothetical protein NC541_01570 [bacterium]|nr:hypothetical protein [bacterium]